MLFIKNQANTIFISKCDVQDYLLLYYYHVHNHIIVVFRAWFYVTYFSVNRFVALESF